MLKMMLGNVLSMKAAIYGNRDELYSGGKKYVKESSDARTNCKRNRKDNFIRRLRDFKRLTCFCFIITELLNANKCLLHFQIHQLNMNANHMELLVCK